MPVWWQSLTIEEIIRSVVDIGLVAYVFYRLIILIRGTRAVQLINGILILAGAWFLSRILDLYTLNWLLDRAFVGLVVAIPIIFQPELRRALEQIGRGRLLPATGLLTEMGEEDIQRVVDHIVRAAEILSRNKTGALVVLERRTQLGEMTDGGIQMDAAVSWELLTNIFIPNTPLHDGAVVIRGNRVLAAGVWLPLAEATVMSTQLGSRHRAGVGVTEQSDAVSVIVSEETGTMSVAHGGRLVRELDEKALRETLMSLLTAQSLIPRSLWSWTRGGAAD